MEDLRGYSPSRSWIKWPMEISWILGVILSVLWIPITGDNRCQFPTTWHGRWYQSGLGEIQIESSIITKKGACIEQHRDYYMLHNRQNDCFQCLLIMQRHPNIIQYKESYCLNLEDLQDVCDLIRVEAILYTLVREPSLPVACPFHDAYHFIYNNNTGGFCSSPQSYTHTCASDSQFHFQFKKCEDAAYTHNLELEFECLASWKDGSDKYIYGNFYGTGLSSRDSYRCFMYQELGTVVQLSMSADATCRGLRSPKDGPLVMEFTKDIYGWPQPSCQFPEWFTKHTWQALGTENLYMPDPRRGVIAVSQRKHHHIVPKVSHAYRCLHSEDGLTYNNHTQFTAVSYTSLGCDNSYQCMRIVQRRNNLVEIHKGGFVQHDTDSCSDFHFRNASVHLLIPRHMHPTDCPYQGRHDILPKATTCPTYLLSGCNRSSDIHITSVCRPIPDHHIQCLESWHEGGRLLLLARNLSHNANKIPNCYSFNYVTGTIEFVLDQDCGRTFQSWLTSPVRYVLNSASGSCEYVRPTQKIETHFETSIESENDYIQEEPGYKHTNEVEPSNKETESANHMYEASNDVKEYQTASGNDCVNSHQIWWSVLLVCLTLSIILHPVR